MNNLEEIIERRNKDKQINAMENIPNNVKERKVFKKTEKIPNEAKVIDSRRVYKIKKNSKEKKLINTKQDQQQGTILQNYENNIKKLFL